MDEQDRDDRYSGPCYYDTEQGIWVNEQYEQVKLPSTQHRLHGGQLGFDRLANNGMDEEATQDVNQQFYKNIQSRQIQRSSIQRYPDCIRLPSLQVRMECSHPIDKIVQETTNQTAPLQRSRRQSQDHSQS